MNQHVDPTIYLVEQLLAAVERRSLKLAELAATVERISGRVEQLEAERAQADDGLSRSQQQPLDTGDTQP